MHAEKEVPKVQNDLLQSISMHSMMNFRLPTKQNSIDALMWSYRTQQAEQVRVQTLQNIELISATK